MKKYEVEIVETLSRVVEIDAESYEEAEAIAEEKYDTCEVILDYEDKKNTNYKPYPSQKIKNDFNIEISFNKRENNLHIKSQNGLEQKYSCKTKDDLKNAIHTYLDLYINYEPVESEIKKDRSRER